MTQSLSAAQPARRARSKIGLMLRCRVLRSPWLLRFIGKVLRRFPWLSQRLRIVARRDAVAALLKRENSFSNTTHAPNLIAGPFVLGMDRTSRYEGDVRMLRGALQRVDAIHGAGAQWSRGFIAAQLAAGRGSFDLVEGYLMPLVWAGLAESFGAEGDALAEGDVMAMLSELRPVAGHLVLRPVATPEVEARAQQAADALHARIARHLGAIAGEWRERDAEAVRRNAIGLAFIGHSVAVQAGAQAMQELLPRPAVLLQLAEQARQLGHDAWSFPAFRRLLHDHLLELLRFRPVFPIIARDVPRDTEYERGDGSTAKIEAGRSIAAWPIAAMFDPDAVPEPERFAPYRAWKHADDRYLVFGHGARSCLGKHQGIELLVSAYAGLLRLPGLRWSSQPRRIQYDGPFVAHLRLEWGG